MATTGVAEACGVPFKDLKPPLSEASLAVLERQGFERTTPVQAATIPLLLTNKDVAVEAVTGSGKTLAFVLPVVEMLRRLTTPLKPHEVGAMIISPTRELAAQIAMVADPFVASVPGLRNVLLVGGTSVAADTAQLSTDGANVLIGTPGRLDDLLERASSIDLRRLEILILDEADRLLDMGFQAQLSSIMARLPKQRRTGLFSATQTRAVEELARSGMRNPVRVEVQVRGSASAAMARASGGPAPKTPAGLTVEYVICEAEEKPSQLVHVLAQQRHFKTIVYVMTCACVDYWGTVLPQLKALRDVPLLALHGKMKQSVRQAALAKFTALPAGVLLCTDVAARGLDIPGVDSILQMDAPQDPKAFLHRAGRTARMGRDGNALIFLSPEEDAYVEFLRLQGVPLEERPKAGDAADITPLLRQAAMADRDVMEKGLRAHVSFLRGYKEHHCNYIFRWKELSLGRLGMAYGLLQLPAMPELRRRPGLGKGFVPAQGVDLDAIGYKDKMREKQRQQNKRKATSSLQGRAKQGVMKEELARSEKKQKRVERETTSRVEDSLDGVEDDDDELDREYRLLKRLKRGAISEAEFDFETGLASEQGLGQPEGDGSCLEQEDPSLPKTTKEEELGTFADKAEKASKKREIRGAKQHTSKLGKQQAHNGMRKKLPKHKRKATYKTKMK